MIDSRTLYFIFPSFKYKFLIILIYIVKIENLFRDFNINIFNKFIISFIKKYKIFLIKYYF